MDIYLTFDVGTTGVKVALIEDSGNMIASDYTEYPMSSPQPGYSEQDPETWWQGLVKGCQQLKERYPQEFAAIRGIGMCGQMHTQVYLDQHFQILRPAITWMDQRSSQIVERIQQDPASRDLVFQETKNFVTTTYTAPQAAWVREQQPEIWSQVRHILVAKDYLKYKLTGKLMTDYAEASGTLLFDVVNETWSDKMFELFGIPREYFPDLAPSDSIMGHVSETAAQLTGIAAGTPVANGSADCLAAALGAGMVNSGQVTLIIGTAGVIAVCSNKPLVDPQFQTLCWHYCLRGKWVTLGITQTAGQSLHWFKNAFDADKEQTSGDIFDEYNQAIQNIPDGSDGLIFLPYLNGERTPYWDASARGVFFGINLFTSKGHCIKAIMEGVSFALRNCVETVESLGISIDEIRAVGGGLKSPVWLNTLGKILRKPIYTVEMPDTGLIGNMILCQQALDGAAETVPTLAKPAQKIHYPDGSEVYEKQYATFLALYENLKQTFKTSL